ncbi:hypothetical protein [Eisenibacter elegans]|jgi:hypothetical protein|uniref:hypothetical protein n=1 Tax=Eisenibacter elegans TaxID=997 RepID=UPI0004027024|nr:hypothetical protein [Eisenibacter elegans]
MLNIAVVCINDQGRPNEIPVSRWVKKGETYHIVQIDKLNAQGGIMGCKLAEINNDDLAPYQYFRLDRFAVPITEEMLEEALEEIDISELTEVLEPKEVEIEIER